MLSKFQALYDEHRYVDLWDTTSRLWQPQTDLDELSVEELILAGRLALRLGGPRMARKLFRRATSLAPLHPRVRYFTQYLHRPHALLLDELAAFEANPDLDGDNEVRANWRGYYAGLWARLRNRPRAMELLRQAHTLWPNDCWLHSMEADVLGLVDDWPAALRLAEHSCSLDPKSPWATISLASALMNNGLMERAVERISAAAADTQSAELVRSACWYQCAWTELLEGEERNASLTQARLLAERIEALSPLADREFKAALARTWLDIATLANNQSEMEHWAEEVGSPFHRQMLANLKQNPDGERIRLPYRRAVQKHNECVPTSVSSALSASNIDVPIAEFAADVTYGGTYEWAAADWLREKSLHVRFFSATAETTWRLLRAGLGFMVTWPADEGGHAVAVIGMDQAAGIVLAHDPASLRTAEYLTRAFDQSASPYGVLGMVSVRPDRAAELDSLLPPEAAIVDAAQAHQKALVVYGPSAARAGLNAIAVRFPDHPAIRELLAIQDLQEGRTGQALANFRALLQEFPHAPLIRSNLIIASRALGNTVLLRETLRTIVETGTIPGVQAATNWVRPHPRYLAEYADLLRASSAARREAEIQLRAALRTDWSSALAWHVLADLRWDQRRIGEATLAYSIASSLAPHHEHYARAYMDALAYSGRIDDGLAWLEDRARNIGSSLEGVSAWMTWIGALEDYGYPERALSAYALAAEQHGSSIAMLGFAVPFLARMGHWEEARTELRLLGQTEGRAAFQEAAVAFHEMRGEPKTALEHAEGWVSELPRSMAARHSVLSLLRRIHGDDAAAARAEQSMRAHPANEEFEEAFCRYAQQRFYWRKIRVLRTRVQRNVEDAWAWRELVFAALAAYERADAHCRRRMTPRVESWLAEATRVSRDHPAMLRAEALWHENRGQWRTAVDGYLSAIKLEPESFYAYRRAWECAARLPDADRRQLWAVMEPIYLEIKQPLPNATEMMGLLAGRFGVPEAEGIVARWRTRRPDDPNVLEAAVDLLLEHGRGRSASARALELLLETVKRFPYHSGLRFSLSRAYRATGDNAQAHSSFTDLVERRPNEVSALINLAWIEHREGDTVRAMRTLDRAGVQVPHDPRLLDQQAQILIDDGRPDEALLLIDRAMRTMSDSVQTFEWAIARFRQCGLPERAVKAARQGTRAFPKGAYLWLLLGKTLKEYPDLAAVGEVESCLLRSLAHNATLYESTDLLAMLLVEQRRYTEASALLRAIEPYLPDPSAALGRLAWVRHEQGELRPAIADLANVLRQAPWYAWGWNRLLLWLDEAKDWGQTKELLHTIPPAMLSDTDFRQRRLQLLEQANADASVIESEWLALLNDLPDNVPLHLRRFDALKKAGRRPEAAKVLRLMLPAEKDNVDLRARLVDVYCHEQNYPAALDEALPIYFAKVEESEWPVNQAWELLRGAGLLHDFAARLLASIKQGSEPTPRALILCAKHVLENNGTGNLPKWLRHTWLVPATWRVQAFVRLVERSSWMRAEHIADLMKALNEGGYRSLVLICWRHLCAKGLDANTMAWAQTGNALVSMRRRRAARALLADWRTRTGVQMWMLANYVIALPRVTRASRSKVIATCDEGLATLAHDHCARYLACMSAEASALNRDGAGLIAIWHTYPKYLQEDPKAGDYFPKWQRYLFYELPIVIRRLSHPDARISTGMLLKLHSRRLWNPVASARLRRIVILVLRILFVVLLLSSALRQWLP